MGQLTDKTEVQAPKRKLIRLEVQEDYSDENQSRCPGYEVVFQDSMTRVARCTMPHPHLERVEVRTYDDGHVDRLRVRAYGTGSRWKTSNLPPVEEIGWAMENGLESRQGETLQQHAARCLAYMAKRSKSPATQQAVLRMSKAAGVDMHTMQAAVDEREMTEEQFNQRMEELRRQREDLHG